MACFAGQMMAWRISEFWLRLDAAGCWMLIEVYRGENVALRAMLTYWIEKKPAQYVKFEWRQGKIEVFARSNQILNRRTVFLEGKMWLICLKITYLASEKVDSVCKHFCKLHGITY